MSDTSHLPVVVMLIVMFLATGGFVLGAMVWLKRLRASLASTVAEALSRQIHHGQKVEEALALLQKNQRQMEGHVQTLAQAEARSRSDIALLRERLEQREAVAEQGGTSTRVLH